MKAKRPGSSRIRHAAIVLSLTMVWQWCLPPVAHAAEYHVSTSYQLKVALTEAAANGVADTIYLAAGVYEGGFVVTPIDGQTLIVRGEPGTGADDVVLDGGGSRRVLGLEGSLTGDVRLLGLTIQHGTTSGHGGGIFIRAWENSTFRLELRDSVLRSNQSGKMGGAVMADAYAGNSRIDLLLVNTLIYGNEARWSGGGMYLAATEVGANNLMTATLVNCTITGNVADAKSAGSQKGGGVSVQAYQGADAHASLSMYNSVVHGNSLGGGAAQDLDVDQIEPGTAEIEARYCDIGVVHDPLGLFTPLHVINIDPSFADPEGDDYHLSLDSLCIDAGTATIPVPPGLSGRDFEGDPRTVGLAPDIGADEAALPLYLPLVE